MLIRNPPSRQAPLFDEIRSCIRRLEQVKQSQKRLISEVKNNKESVSNDCLLFTFSSIYLAWLCTIGLQNLVFQSPEQPFEQISTLQEQHHHTISGAQISWIFAVIAWILMIPVSCSIAISGTDAMQLSRNPTLDLDECPLEPSDINRDINLAARLNINLEYIRVDELIDRFKEKAEKIHSRLTFLKATQDILPKDMQKIILEEADLMTAESLKR